MEKNATFHIETDGEAEDFKKFVDKGVIIEDRTSSLKRAFRRMVTADVFVASQSAFSMSAALLSLGQVIWPECEKEIVNRPPTWRNASCHISRPHLSHSHVSHPHRPPHKVRA